MEYGPVFMGQGRFGLEDCEFALGLQDRNHLRSCWRN